MQAMEKRLNSWNRRNNRASYYSEVADIIKNTSPTFGINSARKCVKKS